MVIILISFVAAGCISGYQPTDRERKGARHSGDSGSGGPAGASSDGRHRGTPKGAGRPRTLSRLGGTISGRATPDCNRRNCVALTFDDGPGPHTARLLGMLSAAKARATFFVLGSGVVRNPGLARRIGREGHEIANHTYSHESLDGMSRPEIQSQLSRTQRAVYAASGIWPKLMRPPYGATNTQVDQVAKSMHLPQILWSVDTMDWQVRDPGRVAASATSKPTPGGIILMHDIHSTTVDAVPRILQGLARRGYVFVTVSELYANRSLSPGSRYMSRSRR